jgi:hypothetical protein
MRRIDPDAWITPEMSLLRQLEHQVRVLVWQQTEDGHANPPRNYPEQIPLTEAEQSAYAASKDQFTYDALPLEELAARIGWTHHN